MKREKPKIMYRNLDVYEVEEILVNNYKSNKLDVLNKLIEYLTIIRLLLPWLFLKV